MFKKNSLSLIVISLLIVSCNQTKKIECTEIEVPTYTQNIAPIIKNKCFKCHAKEVYKRKASRNKIYDYKSLKKMAESGFLMGAITHERGFVAMPYLTGEKIDNCSIDLIAKWITTGMKE